MFDQPIDCMFSKSTYEIIPDEIGPNLRQNEIPSQIQCECHVSLTEIQRRYETEREFEERVERLSECRTRLQKSIVITAKIDCI